MHRSSVAVLALAALAASLLGLGVAAPPATSDLPLPGLEDTVRVITDDLGIPHIFAGSEADLVLVQGYVHARDRFWQMDTTRREVEGSLAELLGRGVNDSVIDGDVQNRTIGLKRASLRTLASLNQEEVDLLNSYSVGINAWIARVRAGLEPLPPEYAELELTAATLRDWDAIDTLGIGKAIATSLSLDIDAGPLEDLAQACQAGDAASPPFDGARLLMEDVRRSAPMDPATTLADAGEPLPYLDGPPAPVRCQDVAGLVARVHRFRTRAEKSRLLVAAMERRQFMVGSNEWGVAASRARPALPMIANDPHLALLWPSRFYENHLIVEGDEPANASGMSFPGAPAVILGQNEHITWGATTNSLDVSDLFDDVLVKGRPGCTSPVALCIESGGELYPVKLEPASYLANDPDDGVLDNVLPTPPFFPDVGSVVLTVDHPIRSFGPIVDIEDAGIVTGPPGETRALVLQFVGFHATRELLAFRRWNRARNLDEFRAGLADFDFGSQNWAYADDQGNLGYFTSGELPLRRDLEQGHVAGLPPFFVRDGFSGENNWVLDLARSQGQSIPFQVLPAEEMPQLVNPTRGWFVNANNDPAGTTLDNDPLDQRRRSKPEAIYYLAGEYADGLRAGRITRLVRGQAESGRRITVSDMQQFQLNVQQLDAELMLPFLLQAFASGEDSDAPEVLAALTADAGVREAVQRFARWDYSTPTGIAEGWDAGAPPQDPMAALAESTAQPVKARKLKLKKAKLKKGKAKNAKFKKLKLKKGKQGKRLDEAGRSVAATIYNVWRGKLLRSVIDARLRGLGAPTVGSGDALKGAFHLLSEEPFDGIGASGVDFFPEPADLSAPQRRDVALLRALRDALDALASEEFATAFGGSSLQDDYRWGRLHRVTLRHTLGGGFSVPPAGGFDDLAPGLPGFARDGGYEAVNASSFSAWAGAGAVGSPPTDRSNEFMFGSGPVRRYVGAAGVMRGGAARVLGFNVTPGGGSGLPESPSLASQVRDWLAGDYHRVAMRSREIPGRDARFEHFVAEP